MSQEFEYFKRYGNEGTTGRYNSPNSRGNWNNESYIHTAKNETRSWVTPTPSATPSVTPTISVTPSVTPPPPSPSTTPSVTPSVTPSTSSL